MRRLRHSHSLGGGLLLGLAVAEQPLWIFAAGVVVGVGLVLAVRVWRRLYRLARRAASRFLPPGIGAERTSPEGAPTREEDGDASGLPPAELSEHERELERRVGLRQGEASGIRAAARIERREQARRDAMSRVLEDHWRDERGRSVEHALDHYSRRVEL